MESGTLDPQLWQACAGSMVEIPSLNSIVLYFPQGHCEHASENVEFGKLSRVPSYIPCRVSAVKFMADQDTDEVFVKLRLAPIDRNEFSFDDNEAVPLIGCENRVKSTSFAKTLTQSDANNGGGFSVPRYCAETLFPRLDYTADPPVQNIIAKDIHGQTWKFRHIYRGTPRRHLLTTGWSSFVNNKNLVAGDSIVFMRAANGDLCVGISRVKKVFDMRMGWNLTGENKKKVKADDVIQAVTLAANGKQFDVVYYPCGNTPEFCVKASVVKSAMHIRWGSGMRFKMAFETEDSSRISWFMGTISSVQVADPVKWPDSPWRILLVNWDESDLLHNVKRVSPWLVEPATANINGVPISAFSSPLKKVRLTTQLPQELPFSYQLVLPSSHHHHHHHQILGVTRNTMTPAGMQGARHAKYGFPTTSPYLDSFKQHPLGISSTCYMKPFPAAASYSLDESVSCLLNVGNSAQESAKSASTKAPFLLFGQPILTDEQILQRGLSNNNSNKTIGIDLNQNKACEELVLGLDGHCKVFLDSEDVGRSLDLSSVRSYDELRRKVRVLFSIGGGETPNLIVYSDATGAVKQLGDEPFQSFLRSARRLRILSGTTNYKNLNNGRSF